MEQYIQIRIANLPADDWREELNSHIEVCGLTPSIRLLNRKIEESGSSTAIDPQIVAAAIAGGSAIIVALIPVIAEVFKKKSKTPPTVINVIFHGTANSQSLQITENNNTQEALKEIIASIGNLTEISIK